MDSARLTCVRLARGLLIGAVTMGIFRARVCLAAGLAAAASAAVISCTNKSLGPLAPGATSGGGASVSPGAQFGPQPNADFSNCGASSVQSGGGGGGVSSAPGPNLASAPGAPEFTSTVSATAPPPPISGGTLIGLGSGNIAVASDPDRDAIYVVDTSAAVLLKTIALQSGDEPGRLVEDGAGLVHVALRSGGALVTVDPGTGMVVTRRPVCPAPRGVAWDSTTDLVWVACATGELVALPASGGAIAKQWVIERDLRDVLIENGNIAVTTFRSAEVLRLTSSGAIARRDSVPPNGNSAPHVAWRAVATRSHGTLLVHQDHSTVSVTTGVPGAYGSGPCGGASGIIGSRCTTIDDATGAATQTEPLTSALSAVLPVDIAVSPDESSVVVALAGNGFSPELPELQVASFDEFSPPNALAPSSGPAGSVTVGCGGPAPSPPGVVSGATSGTVTATGPFSPIAVFDDAGLTDEDDAGDGATLADADAAADAVGTAPAFTAEQVIAVAFDSSGQLLVQSREPPVLHILQLAAVGSGLSNPLGGKQVVLSTISRDDTGHDIFHAMAGAPIACASCHPEGGDDGHVWILNGFARRTPSLRGTIAGTAPYHWPGDELDFPTLTSDVYTGRMGGEQLRDDQASALQSWVEAIPAPAAPSWVDADAASRGKVLFEGTAGCVTCHSGPKLTNNTTMSVGTCDAFQVPPLVGVGWRAPFFHNGCAATLADRFAKCSTPAHGTIHGLSSGQISDLTAYLETL
jgi:hypothetical protein